MFLKFLEKIGRKKVVLDRGPSHPNFKEAKPWMNRYYVLMRYRPKWFPFNILIHEMLADDHGEGVHNHTFPYITIILRGGYWETLSTGKFWRPPGYIGFRSANNLHRVDLEPGTKPLTLFISGPFGLRKGPRSEYGIDFKTKKKLMPKKFEKEFISYCENQNLEVNPNQIKVIKKLEDYHNSNYKSFFSKLFSKQKTKKGFYLYGGVGVGKTMILNFFYDHLEEKKLKKHFNEFMLGFHDFVHEQKEKNEENVINQFVKNLKSKASLVYFDEFQVTNIVDAMILGKLFEQIFKEDIKIILTSNTKISELYKEGLQREQFIPFIKIMEDQSIEYELKIEDDYRKSNDNQKQRYFFPLNQETNFKINKFFRTITKDKKQSSIKINVKGREFKIENFYEGIVRCDFNQLCDQNLGAEDYLEIVKNCKFMVIDQIPQFNDVNSNQQQRFITLLDVIYDKNISLAVTADINLDQFTSSRLLEKPFKRTISRLYELTSNEYN